MCCFHRMFPVKKAKTFGLNLRGCPMTQGAIMGFVYEIVRCVLLAVGIETCL